MKHSNLAYFARVSGAHADKVRKIKEQRDKEKKEEAARKRKEDLDTKGYIAERV